MPNYVPTATFRMLTVMPSPQVDQLEQLEPGWLASQLAQVSAYVDTRLGKRMTVPLTAPYSPTVINWIVKIVTADAYAKLGVKADDAQMERIYKSSDDSYSDLKEVADGQLSLYDLAPSDQSRDRVMYGGVLSYSETSPYVHRDTQVEIGRMEDRNRRGTGGSRR